MTLQKGLREFVELFLSRNIEFLVVGAFAVAHHGYPRTTGDIDLFVRVNPENAEKIAAAVREFGFGALGLQPADFLQADMTIQMGFEPARIDILTGISGVSFEEAWRDRTSGQLDGLPRHVSVLGAPVAKQAGVRMHERQARHQRADRRRPSRVTRQARL